MLWSDYVDLTDPNYYIHGPFTFDTHVNMI